MRESEPPACQNLDLPTWVPEAARNYLIHTERGKSIRQLARISGCHASTVMRQVHKIESRRDDPLIDEALASLGAAHCNPSNSNNAHKETSAMNAPVRSMSTAQDDAVVDREARRILRRLCEQGSCLAVAKDMEKAVVVREASDGSTTRTGVVDRGVAQAMALKDWISCNAPGRISRYRITGAGRAALKRLLAEDDAQRAGFSEAQTPFADQHRHMTDRQFTDEGGARPKRVRYNMAESPVAVMARRKDKNGEPFLAPDLVDAAERLREDFELAQMGPRVAQNWDTFLTGATGGGFRADSGVGDGPSGARERVGAALRDLGPGLGDVALRVCCFLEGMEAAEKRMGWSARSGKIVLRIALQRLKRHYGESQSANMIG